MSLRPVDTASRSATFSTSCTTTTTTTSVSPVELDNPLSVFQKNTEREAIQLREWNAQLQGAEYAEEQLKILRKMQQLPIVENLRALKGREGVNWSDWKGLKKECKEILGQVKLPIAYFKECFARYGGPVIADRIGVCILIEELMEALQQKDIGAIKDVIERFPISVLSQILENIQGSQATSTPSYHRCVIPRVYFCQLNEVKERIYFLQGVRIRLLAAWGEDLMAHPEWGINLSAVVQKKVKEDYAQLHVWNTQLQETTSMEEEQQILIKMQQLRLVERLKCFKTTPGMSWEEWKDYKIECKDVLEKAEARVEEHQSQVCHLQTYSQNNLSRSLETLEKIRKKQGSVMNIVTLPIEIFRRSLGSCKDPSFYPVLMDRMRSCICIEQLRRFLPLQGPDATGEIIDHFPEDILLPLLEEIQRVQPFPMATDHRQSLKMYFCPKEVAEKRIPFLEQLRNRLGMAWGKELMAHAEWGLKFSGV